MRIAVDFDGTLVEPYQHGRVGEWLPGAREFLTWCRRNRHEVVVHSARCNFPQGREQIERKLREAHIEARIEPKPYADYYIDDCAVRFGGDWSSTRRQLRNLMRLN